jgi:hypothetical protein
MMDDWGTRRHITPGDSIMMAVWIGIAGSVITVVIALVIGRAIDGVTTGWPAPANVLEAMLVWAFTRLHLVVAAVGFYVTGERVVHTIVHDRDQIHYQANERLNAELEREREDARRLKIENDIAEWRLKNAQLKPATQPDLLVANNRQSSNWTLTVKHGVSKHELAGRFIEAYARGLRAGKTDLREFIRKEEGVSFQNRDYAILRTLMQQGGVVTAKGFDSRQLTDVLELWRTTHTTRIQGGELVAINEEVA